MKQLRETHSRIEQAAEALFAHLQAQDIKADIGLWEDNLVICASFRDLQFVPTSWWGFTVRKVQYIGNLPILFKGLKGKPQ